MNSSNHRAHRKENSCSITHKLVENRISAKSMICYLFPLCTPNTVKVIMTIVAVIIQSYTTASTRPFPKLVTIISLLIFTKS